MKKATIFGLLALMVVALLTTTSLVNAYRGDYSVKGPNYTEDRQEAMENAFESFSYEAWYELMTEDGRHPGVVEVITEDNFERFIQAHEAGLNGYSETARELRSKLGLNTGPGPEAGRGHGRGLGQYKEQRMHKNLFAECDGNCDLRGFGHGKK